MSADVQAGDRAFVLRTTPIARAGMIVQVIAEADLSDLGLKPCVLGKRTWLVESEGGEFNTIPPWNIHSSLTVLCGCNLKRIPPLLAEDVEREARAPAVRETYDEPVNEL